MSEPDAAPPATDPDPDPAVEHALAAAVAAEQLTRDIDAAVRREQAENLIQRHMLAAAALALVPVALLDMAGLIASQIAMTRALARCFDVPFDEVRARAVLLSLLTGSAPTLSMLALSSGAKLIPGIGTLAGSGSIGVAGGAVTYALGKVLAHHFEHGGTLRGLDGSRLRGRFRRELRRGWSLAQGAIPGSRKRPSADQVNAAD
ncbi:DUF697 domain-containing protein [Thiohalocapsa sp. ML1]|jgi:uncharacterized protein (DUF697 family)|uniref:DUF697 domain-containing protein n=1 Tax=Thiohalocapsa sp. ML1 TaxID=1431688 RepID=UPI0007322CB8|nr:DUF697 domain-containing protein [Thiohalocapsa sp. ML1]